MCIDKLSSDTCVIRNIIFCPLSIIKPICNIEYIKWINNSVVSTKTQCLHLFLLITACFDFKIIPNTQSAATHVCVAGCAFVRRNKKERSLLKYFYACSRRWTESACGPEYFVAFLFVFSIRNLTFK